MEGREGVGSRGERRGRKRRMEGRGVDGLEGRKEVETKGKVKGGERRLRGKKGILGEGLEERGRCRGRARGRGRGKMVGVGGGL